MISRKRKASYPPRKERRAKRYRGLGFAPRQFQRGEWKYLDTQFTHGVFATPSQSLLNGLVPGTGASQRIGMKVAIRSIECRVTVNTYPASGLDNFVRWFIVIDKQANASPPTAITDVLTPGSVLSFRNLANRRRFKIILDKMFYMGNSMNEHKDSDQRVFKYYLKFKTPIIVEYNTGTAGTVYDISASSLWFMSLGTATTAQTGSVLNGNIRIRYTDL